MKGYWNSNSYIVLTFKERELLSDEYHLNEQLYMKYIQSTRLSVNIKYIFPSINKTY